MAARWFGRVVLIGIGANLLLAVPTLIRPDAAVAMTGVIFFLLQPAEYRLLALFDLTLLLPQAALFALMNRAGPT